MTKRIKVHLDATLIEEYENGDARVRIMGTEKIIPATQWNELNSNNRVRQDEQTTSNTGSDNSTTQPNGVNVENRPY